MKIFVQRVLKGEVNIDNNLVSSIGKGEVLLVGFGKEDNEYIVDKMIEKLLKLRIFEDENGLTNVNITNVDGEILAVSQFTLYASLVDGNRPSFTNCLEIDKAKQLYEYFCFKLSSSYPKVKYGIFQADMKVSLINDGPFSIMLDSKEIIKHV